MKPLLLDLFCKAGGASMGYRLSGFDVVGVDIEMQRRYPFEFIQMDALECLRALIAGGTIRSAGLFGREYRISDFATVTASPPCQLYCALNHMVKKDYPDLVAPTRELLTKTGLPYVIENVVGAPLLNPAVLCGTMFGLQTSCGAQLQRHRLFETNWGLVCDLQCNHEGRYLSVTGTGNTNGNVRRPVISITGHTPNDHAAIGRRRRTIMVAGATPRDPAEEMRIRKTKRVISVTVDSPKDHKTIHERRKVITVTGSTPQQNVERNAVRETFSTDAAREAMGIPWMVMSELSQAIPPAYTEYIGKQLMQFLEASK